MQFRVEPSSIRDASLTVPGDKSVSHRSLMLGSLAEGRTEVSGFLAGEDCLSTLAAMRAMGVNIERPTETDVVINGVGMHGLQAAAGELDLGNSGTAMRLMAGLLAGQAFDSVLVGDESLTGRPMQRIITPLAQMGAVIDSREGKPPLRINGGNALSAVHYDLPMASAQVKSAVLLAGLFAEGTTSVSEPDVTRDHTERMLRSMGVSVLADGKRISIEGGQRLQATSIQVPADLSSATFLMLAAIISESADLLIQNVGINPTRTGVIDIFKGMGADLALLNERRFGDEPVADIRVRASKLRGGEVDPALVSLAIDEFPALFVAAATAEGQTVFDGIGELRVKESDRLAVMAQVLHAFGVECEELDDGLIIQGKKNQDKGISPLRAAHVQSHHDHRIAMSATILGLAADGETIIDDADCVDTSFPGFVELLQSLGANIQVEEINPT